MEKEITYDIISVEANEIKLQRTINKTWWRRGRYGYYQKTFEERSILRIDVSRLEWLIKRAYEGVRTTVRPSEIRAIELLLELDYEFEEDPSFLLYMEENGWDV